MRMGIACALKELCRRLDGPECCFVTGSGAQALQMCREWMPDVMVVSMALRDMDGRMLTEALAREGLRKTPVIVAAGPRDFDCAAEIPLSSGRDEILRLWENMGCEENPMLRLRPCCADGIVRSLDILGVPARLKGRKCMELALEMILRNGELTANLSRRLYPSVGKDMGMSPGSVERAIRTAMENTWKRPAYAHFADLADPERGMPTAGAFLAGMAESIRLGRIR